MKYENNLEQKGILSEKILKVIDKIILLVPDVLFGGSIALNAVGLINRPIKDIDLFLPKLNNGETFSFFNNSSEILPDEQFSESVTDVNGEPIKRTGYVMNDIKICCFEVSENSLQHSKFKFLNREINIQNVNNAILAKKAYADKSGKHKNDLNDIEEFLKNLNI